MNRIDEVTRIEIDAVLAFLRAVVPFQSRVARIMRTISEAAHFGGYLNSTQGKLKNLCVSKDVARLLARSDQKAFLAQTVLEHPLPLARIYEDLAAEVTAVTAEHVLSALSTYPLITVTKEEDLRLPSSGWASPEERYSHAGIEVGRIDRIAFGREPIWTPEALPARNPGISPGGHFASAASKAKVYTTIRSLVLGKATMPIVGTDRSQDENRRLAEQCLLNLCRPFEPSMRPEKFWDEGWRHFRWAGIRAATGSDDVEAHESCRVFSDFERLCVPDWDYPQRSLRHEGWGTEAKKYISGDPPYNRKGVVRNRSKLRKTVRMARQLKEAIEQHGESAYLDGVFGPGFLTEVLVPTPYLVRKWHQYLCRFIGGNNPITAFHLMMDLGLPCVKPDIVLTDMFYRLGWLEGASLQFGMTRPQIREHYLSPEVYWPVQRVALEVAREITPLFGSNPVRELDWIMVKYGQEPEPRFGIVRNLDKEDPDRLALLS